MTPAEEKRSDDQDQDVAPSDDEAEKAEDDVEETSKESFPASDPPAW